MYLGTVAELSSDTRFEIVTKPPGLLREAWKTLVFELAYSGNVVNSLRAKDLK
jgi:hypothetical protein